MPLPRLPKSPRRKGIRQTAERSSSITPPPRSQTLTREQQFYAGHYLDGRPHNGTPRKPAIPGVSRLQERALVNIEEDVDELSQDATQEQFPSGTPPAKRRCPSHRIERLSVEDEIFRLEEMIELLRAESCTLDRSISAILHQNNLQMHRNSEEEALRQELFQRLSDIIALLRDRAFLRPTIQFEKFCHFINSSEFVNIYGADLVGCMLTQLDPLLATTAIIERRAKMASSASKSSGAAYDCSFRLDKPVEQAEDAALCAKSKAVLQHEMENLQESCREKKLRLACEVSRRDQLAHEFSMRLAECNKGVFGACSEISSLCLLRPIVFRFFKLPQARPLPADSCAKDQSVMERKSFK